MVARTVAAPVIEHLPEMPQAAAMLGGSRDIVYICLRSGFVVAVTGPGVPLMPNGVAVGEQLTAPAASVDGAEAGRSWLVLGDLTVSWDAARPPVWDSRPVPWAGSAGDVAHLGDALLNGLGVSPVLNSERLTRAFGVVGCPLARDLGGRLAAAQLFESVLHRDVAAAGRAAVHLAGRGSGLTPEGDDLLSSCAAAVALLGPAVGDFRSAEREAWLNAVCHGAAARTTTALARTLLELASRGQVAAPLHDLLAESPVDAGWPGALARLRQIGSATGLVYGLGFGAAALLLARTSKTPVGRGHTKETTRC